jgi:hypothetical protein
MARKWWTLTAPLAGMAAHPTRSPTLTAAS